MNEYLSKLNSQQKDAVEYCEGPQLVIAGAGSGKTRVLTYKIVHLLNLGYEPWRILALTFTNKAAKEMRERVEALVGHTTASKLWMGTFHSIFARILRSNAERIGFKSNFTIYDSSDSKSLVKTIIKDMQLDEKIYKPSVVLNAISTAKNALISPEDYATYKDIMDADRQARRPLLHAIYRNYRDRCVVAGAMDFDDLLYYTNVLLRDNPDVLHHYQEYFRYLLVDEYQDTNFAQHVIVTQLTKINEKLCVVGDDAQSIYSFRGANIRNILDLKKSCPGLQTFKLERNYRSTRNIIDAAGSLIDKNREQIRKNVYSENETGAPIEVSKCYSDFEEAYQVASRLSQVKMASGDSCDEFAILYRTNAQSRVLEEALRKRNIPYRIYGGLSFYQRKEVKDAIAYFRMSINPDDDEALKRIINFPARGIGETTLNKLTRCALDNNTSVWNVITHPETYDVGVNSGTAKKLAGFCDLIQDFIDANDAGKDAYEVARKIIDRTGLFTMLLTDGTPESISKQENLQELLNGVQEFVETRVEEGSDEMSLMHFMSEVSLATDQDSDSDGVEERVTLMTVHAAKGLEFNNVFIVGVEEELFPSAMAQDSPSQIEEERRLLYVAITRARKFCMISYAASRFRNGQTMSCRPSRFLGDIDQRYLKLSAGADFGPGYPQTRPTLNYRISTMSGSGRSLNELRRKPMSTSSYGTPIGGGAGGTRRAEMPQTATHAPKTGGSGGYTLHSITEIAPGMDIEHGKFGRGVIIEIDRSGADPRIVVEFNNTDTRTLMLKFAKFAIIN
ncbi:MAG: UvrD-helicase domain-containing protein [Muribaculaceae bacterium]|nr:UvrD-helicase domain-containing protein [Muribaculaceae bacterium]